MKNITQIAIIVIAVLAVGAFIWFSASYFFSLNEQVSQNTQNIQGIVQFLNQKTQPAGAAVPAPSTK